MARQSNGANLKDLVRNLGGEPKDTNAELIDQLESLVSAGGEPSQAAVEAAVERYMSEHEGLLTDEDMGEIFGG